MNTKTFFSLLALLLLGVCCMLFDSTPQPPAPLDAAKPTSMEHALTPPLVSTLRAIIDVPPTYGMVRTHHGRTSCRASIPLPYIIPANTIPRAGSEWRCLFVTTVSNSPPEPDWFAWIVLSTTTPAPTLPVELTPLGMPGCMLHVNPDQLVSVAPGMLESPMLSRTPGRGQILMRWTPQIGHVGMHVWMQLLVHAPGSSPGGFLLSHAIEVVVGSP